MTAEYAQLPEGGEWATGSLLDKANVGKFVHVKGHAWSAVTSIVKVGRTNVHVASNGYGGTEAYRLHVEDSGIAYAEFGYFVQTDQHKAESDERAKFGGLLREHERNGWRKLSMDSLRQITAILEGLGTGDALS